MKIAQVCPYDIDRPGGVQTHILDTAVALQELGHAIVIIAPGTGGARHEYYKAGVEIIRIGHAHKIAFGETSYEISIALGAQWNALKSIMADGHFDIVQYHTIWTPFLALQAFSCSTSPAIATFHDTTANTVTGRTLRFIFRLVSRHLLPRFAAIITPSDAPKGHLVVGPGQTITVLPPASNLRRFMSSVGCESQLRDGRINILFLGRLEPRKGAMLLLRAFHLLQSEGHGVRLIVAGSGDEDASLRAYAQRHSVPNVVFVGSFKSDDTPKWYATADIFCAPSPHGESFGIVIAEAMASGKPVVAAANAGYRTILVGEAAQFLTPPGDVEALRNALRTLVEDADLRARLGEWGRAEALRYDSRTLAPQFVEIYQQAITNSRFISRTET